jgi:hypothetical protein
MGWWPYSREAGISVPAFIARPVFALLTLAVAGCGQTSAPPPAMVVDPPPAVAEDISTTTAGVKSQSVVDPAVLTQLDALGLAEIGLELDAPLELEETSSDTSRGFQGPAPRTIPESKLPIDRRRPASLLQGTMAAMAAKDESALARLSRDRATHPTLNEDDAADARRRFLTPAIRPYWDRVRKALRAGEYEVSVEGRSATLRMKVGGALGTTRIQLRQEDDGWYLAK